MRRTGLGRHGRLADSAGDPLDGLVNLFDLGIVLAVAFLVAGLTLTFDRDQKRIERPRSTMGGTALPNPTRAPSATGRGRAVGTVYRLPDGKLVYVEGKRR
jgi:hypothetical protein